MPPSEVAEVMAGMVGTGVMVETIVVGILTGAVPLEAQVVHSTLLVAVVMITGTGTVVEAAGALLEEGRMLMALEAMQ